MKRLGPPFGSGPGEDKLRVAGQRSHTRSVAGRATPTSPSASRSTGPAARLDQSNPSADETVRRGQHAWARVRGDHTWADWLHVGAALVIGRTEAMLEAHVNEPIGHNYNKAFGTWLQNYGFGTIDKGDRARLFEVMDKLVEIESWRATLTENQRLLLNHPTTVLRKWKAATADPDPNAQPKVSAIAKLKASVAELSEENFHLKREVDAGGENLWTCHDKSEKIAAVIVAKLSPTNARRVAQAILSEPRKTASRGAPTTKTAIAPTIAADIIALWNSASQNEHLAVINGIGLGALLAALPGHWIAAIETWLAERRRSSVPAVQVDPASIPPDLSIPRCLWRDRPDAENMASDHPPTSVSPSSALECA